MANNPYEAPKADTEHHRDKWRIKKPMAIWVTQCLSSLMVMLLILGIISITIVLSRTPSANDSIGHELVGLVVRLAFFSLSVATLYATVKKPKWAYAACVSFSLVFFMFFIFIAYFTDSEGVQFSTQAEQMGAGTAKLIFLLLALYYPYTVIGESDVFDYLNDIAEK